MMLQPNRVKVAFRSGTPTFGIYVTTPAPRIIELAAGAGFDFVRVDLDGGIMNIETVENMIRTAHAVGVTPFVRVPGFDAELIQALLRMGALGIIVPRLTSRAQVEAAVRATKVPPVGECRLGPGGPTGGYGHVSMADYLAWASEHILLSVQIETKSAVDAIAEIVAVPGVDMVQSGRNDLSYEYGVPGQQYHPLVLEAEQRAFNAALGAGMMATVQYQILREHAHVETIRNLIAKGVLCFSVGNDADLVFAYRRLLAELKD